MMPECRLRPAGLEDLEVLTAMYGECELILRRQGGPPPSPEAQNREAVRDVLEAPHCLALLALDAAGAPEGYAMGAVHGERLHVGSVYLKPSARRGMTARRLVLELEAWGRSRGAIVALANVLPENRSRLLLEAGGYVPTTIELRRPL